MLLLTENSTPQNSSKYAISRSQNKKFYGGALPLPRPHGLMEFAGVDKAARSKMGVWKENAGVDISARYGKGGLCRSGQCGTIVARVDNAGRKNVSKLV